MAATREIRFREARDSDLRSIVELLADDPLGAQRESTADPLPPGYQEAFDAIAADRHNELLVGEIEGRVVAVLQMTFIPSLTRKGAWRALIEGVRVAEPQRSSGVGTALLEHAIDRARRRGCRLVQLTTDKRRSGAVRFYERLGFVASHDGMKLEITPPPDGS